MPVSDLLDDALKRCKSCRATDKNGTHDGGVKWQRHARPLSGYLLFGKRSIHMGLVGRSRYTYGVNNVTSPSSYRRTTSKRTEVSSTSQQYGLFYHKACPR